MRRTLCLALVMLLLCGNECSSAQPAPRSTPIATTSPEKHKPRPEPSPTPVFHSPAPTISAPPVIASPSPTDAPTLAPSASDPPVLASPSPAPATDAPTSTPGATAAPSPTLPVETPTVGPIATEPPTPAPEIPTPDPTPAPTVAPTVDPTPTLVAVGTVTSYSNIVVVQSKSAKTTSSATISITFTNAPTQSDRIYCGISQDAGSGTTVASGSSGYSAVSLGGSTQLNAGSTALAIWAKTAGAGEPSTVSFTLTGSVSNLHLGCAEVAYENSTTPELLTDSVIASTALSSGVVATSPNDTPAQPGLQLLFETVRGATAGDTTDNATLDYDDAAGTIDAHLQHQGPLTAGSLVPARVAWPSVPTGAVGAAIVVAPIEDPGTTVAIATATPAPTAAPSIPKHIPTIEYGTGAYNGVAGNGTTSGPSFSFQCKYLTYAYSDDISQYHACGTKVGFYVSFWRQYSDDPTDYTPLAPGGAYAGAETLNCSSTPVTDQTSASYGIGYLADPRLAMSASYAQWVITHRRSNASSYDFVFSDNSTSPRGITGGPVCSYVYTTWRDDMASSFTTIGNAINVHFIINGMNDALYPVGSPVGAAVEPVLTSTRVLGGMDEGCYSTRYVSDGYLTGSTWVNIANTEIATVAAGKLFNCYSNQITAAASAIPSRMYALVSLELAGDPCCDLWQTAYAVSSNFHVMPESQFVPTGPVTTGSTVSTYSLGSGLYARAYSACGWKGVSIGGCRLVVNTNDSGAALAVSSTGYAHSMVITGGGIYEGGTVTFTGAPCTSLAPHSACVQTP